MQGFTFITYTYQSTISDFAMDVGDKFDITNTNDVKYLTYIMGNSWEFNGAVSQTWTAKGENELNNTYSSKGPITQQLENIVKEQIPSVYEQAVNKATELITEFNGGYVIKKSGELFIADNEDLDKAQHIWRWNINGLGYSSTGINGPYGTAITMNGKIVADFITAGTMSADRILGGTLRAGGTNNGNGTIQVLDASGNVVVTLHKDGITMADGTKIIGGLGIYSNLQFVSTGKKYGSNESAVSGEFVEVGFEVDNLGSENFKTNIIINAYIPSGFTVSEAKITLYHAPVHCTSGSGSVFWGYSRALKLYKADDITDIYKEVYIGGQYRNYDNANYSEITNAFGSGGYTPSAPTDSSHKASQKLSIDIKSSLASGNNRLKIETGNNPPSYNTTSSNYYINEENCRKQTGLVFAVLNVIGYMK